METVTRCHCGAVMRPAWFKVEGQTVFRSWTNRDGNDNYEPGLCCPDPECGSFEF